MARRVNISHLGRTKGGDRRGIAGAGTEGLNAKTTNWKKGRDGDCTSNNLRQGLKKIGTRVP